MTRDYQPWTPEEDQHLRDHWQRPDLTTAQIGEMIGRRPHAVNSRVRKQLKLGNRPAFDPWGPLFDEVAKLYAAGAGPSELAKRFGMTRNQVVGKLWRHGLLREPALPAPKPPKAVRAPKLAGPAKPKGVMVLAVVGGRAQPNPVELRAASAKANAEARERPADDVLMRARAFCPLPGFESVPFGSKGCKWPVGGEGADMLCCGRERDGAKPYCATHDRASRPPVQAKQKIDKRLGISSVRRAA